jgi:hypothetical protein
MVRFSLFEKRGNEWVRMTTKSYPKETARMVWMDALIEPFTKPENCKGVRQLKKVRF